MKCCGKCKQTKPLPDFYKQSKSKDGLQNNCKDCQREQRRKNMQAENATPEGRAKHLARTLAYKERLKRENPEQWRVQHNRAQNNHYHKNKEKFLAIHARYLARIREELSPLYVRKLIAKVVGCSRSDVPDELIAAKKAHMAASRLIKEKSK